MPFYDDPTGVPGLSDIEVTGTVFTPNGDPAVGRVKFEFPVFALPEDDITVAARPVNVQLDTGGQFITVLPNIGDPGIVPSDATVKVTIFVKGAEPHTFNVRLPEGGISVDIADLVPTSASGGVFMLPELGLIKDVDTTGATAGDVLTFDGTNWAAAEPAGGGDIVALPAQGMVFRFVRYTCRIGAAGSSTTYSPTNTSVSEPTAGGGFTAVQETGYNEDVTLEVRNWNNSSVTDNSAHTRYGVEFDCELTAGTYAIAPDALATTSARLLRVYVNDVLIGETWARGAYNRPFHPLTFTAVDGPATIRIEPFRQWFDGTGSFSAFIFGAFITKTA